MTNLSAPTMRIVIYEGAGSAGLPDALRGELMLTLLQRGYSVSCVRNGGTLASLERGSVLVMGRFADKTPPQAMDTSGQVSVLARGTNWSEIICTWSPWLIQTSVLRGTPAKRSSDSIAGVT